MVCEVCNDAPVVTLLVAREPANLRTQGVCRHCADQLGDTDWALSLIWPGPDLNREFFYAKRWIDQTTDRARRLLQAARTIR